MNETHIIRFWGLFVAGVITLANFFKQDFPNVLIGIFYVIIFVMLIVIDIGEKRDGKKKRV